ncbi:hypothetical protein NDU88_001390 [Pleurodeles waltl]|uniref:Uncharacterized protein n=1 Tax=Pleurodeles waltl TaxID=8319 RepID=A0AAV7SAT6_PLEWA|nr:hypothetical protein NDU88_001390 [Pleurodeles waltl]
MENPSCGQFIPGILGRRCNVQVWLQELLDSSERIGTRMTIWRDARVGSVNAVPKLKFDLSFFECGTASTRSSTLVLESTVVSWR